jgi:hypothetical protein
MLINIRRTLAAVISVCNVYVNFLIKNFTEIFHMVSKGNLSSFQCKKSLDWCESVGEVDSLILILIDYYVPALTPRLH